MLRSLFLLLAVSSVAATSVVHAQTPQSVAQASQPDAQTLQSLLTEVRELRQDLLTSMARIQNSQILLSRVEAQQATVSRASQRLDQARARYSDAQNRSKRIAAEVARLDNTTTEQETAAQQQNFKETVDREKTELTLAASDEQQRQASEQEATQQFKDEQEKLNALESQLDALVKEAARAATH